MYFSKPASEVSLISDQLPDFIIVGRNVFAQLVKSMPFILDSIWWNLMFWAANNQTNLGVNWIN